MMMSLENWISKTWEGWSYVVVDVKTVRPYKSTSYQEVFALPARAHHQWILSPSFSPHNQTRSRVHDQSASSEWVFLLYNSRQVFETWSRSGEWWNSAGRVSKSRETYRARSAGETPLWTLTSQILDHLQLDPPAVAVYGCRRDTKDSISAEAVEILSTFTSKCHVNSPC